ncbi:uncharacterized protein [Solanum lycopersicum]|uniref:uncharacterized protein n=1 Tax=Solanum lycopersicum TaxID=4081 RepID=UPI003749062D
MKKDAYFHWDQSCQNAFESIKSYFLNSPVLGAPTPGKLLILYIASQDRSLGALLVQENEAKKEQALYYLTVKGQALANLLANHPLSGKWETSDEFPDEDTFFTKELPSWTMFVDGSACREKAGPGVVLISPEGLILPFSFVLGETCSNNVAEYQALIVGLEMASDMKNPQLDVSGDSLLIINQLLRSYEVKKEDFLSYHQYATFLLERFDRVFLNQVLREENRMVDALANLATTMALGENKTKKVRTCHHISIRVAEEEDWRKPLIEYLEHGRLHEDPRVSADIKRRAPRFIFHDEILFLRSVEGLFLRCLEKEEAQQTMEKAHSGTCGARQSGSKLHFRIKRMGYYWPTMAMNCLEHAKKCQACQFHAKYIHQSPEALHLTIASWPFDAWGLDVVGPLPKS